MNLPKEELEKFSLEDKVVSKYMGKLNRINEDPVFLNLIDYEEDNKRLMNSMKREAREAGYEEGREKEKLSIASQLLKRNIPIQEIIEITALSEEKINTIVSIFFFVMSIPQLYIFIHIKFIDFKVPNKLFFFIILNIINSI